MLPVSTMKPSTRVSPVASCPFLLPLLSSSCSILATPAAACRASLPCPLPCHTPDPVSYVRRAGGQPFHAGCNGPPASACSSPRPRAPKQGPQPVHIRLTATFWPSLLLPAHPGLRVCTRATRHAAPKPRELNSAF